MGKGRSYKVVFLQVFLFCANGWASDAWDRMNERHAEIWREQAEREQWKPHKWASRDLVEKLEAQEREQSAHKYQIAVWTGLSTGTAADQWTITKDTKTYTLNEFVASGEFCFIYHHWWKQVRQVKCICYRCSLCGKEWHGFLPIEERPE